MTVSDFERTRSPRSVRGRPRRHRGSRAPSRDGRAREVRRVGGEEGALRVPRLGARRSPRSATSGGFQHGSLLAYERERLLVGKEEAVREAGPDRVAHVALPEDAVERQVVNLVCVLGGLAHGEHAAHADDHTPGLLGERGALGIEEAERLLPAAAR